MSKGLFVVMGEDSVPFVVRGDYEVGGEYDDQPIVSEIELPGDAEQLEGLMEINEVEGLILHALDAAYNQGRLDERSRITSRIQRTLVGE